MRKHTFHVAIACTTFGLSVFLTSVWNWLGWKRADVPIHTVYVRALESSPTILKAEPGLVEIYRDYAAAQTNHDFGFFNRVEADDYVLFSDGKTMSRNEAMQWLKSSPPSLVYKLEDVSMKVYGDAAVVTGRITVTNRRGSSTSWRWIDVCVKRDGRWQIQSTTQIN